MAREHVPPFVVNGRYLPCMMVLDDEDLGSLMRAAMSYHLNGQLEENEYPSVPAAALYCLIRDDLDDYHDKLETLAAGRHKAVS